MVGNVLSSFYFAVIAPLLHFTINVARNNGDLQKGCKQKILFIFYQKEYGSPSKLRISDGLLPKGNLPVLVSFNENKKECSCVFLALGLPQTCALDIPALS